MFTSKTLFVVGAGASCELGLPSGAELKDWIAERLDIKFRDFNDQYSGSIHISDALRAQARAAGLNSINPYLPAAWQIRDGMPQAISIDNYIDAHNDNNELELCGKLAITHSILTAERQSLLFYQPHQDQQMRFDALGATWLNSFMQLLTEGVRKANVESIFENVSFIVFNYDRCVEHFLTHALMNYYRIGHEESQSILKSLPIVHPYGTVGRLPWQEGRGETVDFGASIGGDNLLRASRNIKTFTERIEEEAELKSIQDKVAEAKQIIFLGFSFLKQNMTLLTPPKSLTKDKSILATTFGISKSDSQVVDNQIFALTQRPRHAVNIELANLKCAELFKEYWRSITA